MPKNCCRACSNAELEEFINLGNMPLAGGFLADQQAINHEKYFPLSVHVCMSCGLVQIVDPVDPSILFQDYSFSSSTVVPLVQHFEQFALWMKQHYNPTKVVEFGCNDGIMLKPLEKLGIKACGIDISENISEIARTNGLDVKTGFFNKESAVEIRERIGRVDIVSGSNAFAHNEDPSKIIEGAKEILNFEGLLILEVMYAGDLLEQLQWDTLYHEHLTFYSLSTLSTLLERYGFTMVHAERIPMHGGSLRIVAKLGKGKPSERMNEILAYEKTTSLNDPMTWIHFGEKAFRKISVVLETIAKLAESSRIWGYGAAGKATLWVNACKMDYLERMVDSSSLRAGKLMPGTHTPIVFPDEMKKTPPDYVFVTAWNYADLICSKENWFKGIWMIPLPDLRFF